jgi:hypothetical protein
LVYFNGLAIVQVFYPILWALLASLAIWPIKKAIIDWIDTAGRSENLVLYSLHTVVQVFDGVSGMLHRAYALYKAVVTPLVHPLLENCAVRGSVARKLGRLLAFVMWIDLPTSLGGKPLFAGFATVEKAAKPTDTPAPDAVRTVAASVVTGTSQPVATANQHQARRSERRTSFDLGSFDGADSTLQSPALTASRGPFFHTPMRRLDMTSFGSVVDLTEPKRPSAPSSPPLHIAPTAMKVQPFSIGTRHSVHHHRAISEYTPPKRSDSGAANVFWKSLAAAYTLNFLRQYADIAKTGVVLYLCGATTVGAVRWLVRVRSVRDGAILVHKRIRDGLVHWDERLGRSLTRVAAGAAVLLSGLSNVTLKPLHWGLRVLIAPWRHTFVAIVLIFTLLGGAAMFAFFTTYSISSEIISAGRELRSVIRLCVYRSRQSACKHYGQLLYDAYGVCLLRRYFTEQVGSVNLQHLGLVDYISNPSSTLDLLRTNLENSGQLVNSTLDWIETRCVPHICSSSLLFKLSTCVATMMSSRYDRHMAYRPYCWCIRSVVRNLHHF